MSIVSSGGTDTSSMMSFLMQDRDRAAAQENRLKAQSDELAAAEEAKRVARLKGGGLQAFTTAGYTGYSDRTLGGGASLTAAA